MKCSKFNFTVGIVTGIMLVLTLIQINKVYNINQGIQLATTMYEYDPKYINELDDALRKQVTEEMFRLHTISSDQRQMRVYLRFQGSASKINILSAEPGRIIYSINHPKIDPNLAFMLEYKMKGFKVSKINEGSIVHSPGSSIDFYQ